MGRAIGQRLTRIATVASLLLSQIATEQDQSHYWKAEVEAKAEVQAKRKKVRGLRNVSRFTFHVCSLGFVKGKPDPKRAALTDDTLHSDCPAMFLDDTFHDREA